MSQSIIISPFLEAQRLFNLGQPVFQGTKNVRDQLYNGWSIAGRQGLASGYHLLLQNLNFQASDISCIFAKQFSTLMLFRAQKAGP